MKKSNVLAGMWRGSAEYVDADATVSLIQTRIKNPRLALAMAKRIVDRCKPVVVDTYIPRCYADMDDVQFKVVAKGILRRSRTEGEFLRGLKQIQYPYHYAMTTTPVEVGPDGRELGGHVMVMVMLHGHNDVISL